MSEEEIIKLRTRLQLAEDSNKILVQKFKNKEKDLKMINNLYLNEKKKVNTIYTALTTRNVDENNYKKAIEWIIKIIEEG
mgnify:FL=1|jgi:hypothetical protein